MGPMYEGATHGGDQARGRNKCAAVNHPCPSCAYPRSSERDEQSCALWMQLSSGKSQWALCMCTTTSRQGVLLQSGRETGAHTDEYISSSAPKKKWAMRGAPCYVPRTEHLLHKPTDGLDRIRQQHSTAECKSDPVVLCAGYNGMCVATLSSAQLAAWR